MQLAAECHYEGARWKAKVHCKSMHKFTSRGMLNNASTPTLNMISAATHVYTSAESIA